MVGSYHRFPSVCGGLDSQTAYEANAAMNYDDPNVVDFYHRHPRLDLSQGYFLGVEITSSSLFKWNSPKMSYVRGSCPDPGHVRVKLLLLLQG